MLARIGLLFSLTWLMGLEATLFEVLGQASSGRDLILVAGGGFLLAKGTHEIHVELEGEDRKARAARVGRTALGAVLAQIVLRPRAAGGLRAGAARRPAA